MSNRTVHHPHKRDNAFSGIHEHITPSGGAAFRVYYLDRSYVRQRRELDRLEGKRVYPPGHPRFIRTGWFWIRVKDSEDLRGDRACGPYTSSRAAYQAAVDYLDKGLS
jgi:hypothetical protein